jgi:hypothetical protein
MGSVYALAMGTYQQRQENSVNKENKDAEEVGF